MKEYDLLKGFADEMVYEMNYVSSYYAEQKDYEKLQALNSILRGVCLSSSINLEIITKGARIIGEVHWLSMPFVHKLGVFSKALEKAYSSYLTRDRGLAESKIPA